MQTQGKSKTQLRKTHKKDNQKTTEGAQKKRAEQKYERAEKPPPAHATMQKAVTMPERAKKNRK